MWKSDNFPTTCLSDRFLTHFLLTKNDFTVAEKSLNIHTVVKIPGPYLNVYSSTRDLELLDTIKRRNIEFMCYVRVFQLLEKNVAQQFF